jgi:hypothetical protein
MTNDRFVDPQDVDTTEPTHPNLETTDKPPESYRDFRIPPHADLARIRYRHDPGFAHSVNVAYKWLDGVETPEDVFEAYGGKRLRITRNLLGESYYGGDVAPYVGFVFDDDRLDRFADWVDDPASAYADREPPEWLTPVRLALSKDGKAMLDEAVERWKAGDVRHAELAAFADSITDADEVDPPDDVDIPIEFDATDTPEPDTSFDTGRVARYVLIAATVLTLIVLVYVALTV